MELCDSTGIARDDNDLVTGVAEPIKDLPEAAKKQPADGSKNKTSPWFGEVSPLLASDGTKR